MTMPTFHRYIGIDYSGAQVPTASLPGLRVYLAESGAEAREVPPPPSPRKYWTRRGLAEWLVDRLREAGPTIVGIDHGFSFPLQYFQKYRLAHDWPAFLDDFQAHWPTDDDNMYVDFVRDGHRGAGAKRTGNSRWRRLTEQRTKGAKSVFLFDVQGAVGKSTFSGLPWLRYMRRELGARVHFWPFDGWTPPAGRSVVAEVYPSLWRDGFPRRDGRTDDQHDAYVVAERLRRADAAGELAPWFEAPSDATAREVADIEGWILGVPTEGEANTKQEPRAPTRSPRAVSAERGPTEPAGPSTRFLEDLPRDQVVIAEVLLRFHREVFLPDLERLLQEKLSLVGLRLDERFAELHRRFDRLDALAAETKATLQRIEEPDRRPKER